MKLIVKLTYRDDKDEEFECVDTPAISDWVTLFMENLQRIHIPKDAIAKVTCSVV